MIARSATGPSRFALPMMPWMRAAVEQVVARPVLDRVVRLLDDEARQDRRADEDRHPQLEHEREPEDPLQRGRDGAHELAPGQHAADEQRLESW